MIDKTLLAIALTGCWTAGDLGEPTQAKAVFHVDPHEVTSCSNADYIGDVIIGSADAGYAMVQRWSPPHDGGCDDNMGGNQQRIPVPVRYFTKSGSTSVKIAEAGLSGFSGPEPRVGFSTEPIWFFVDDTSMTRFVLANKDAELVSSMPDGGHGGGLVTDGFVVDPDGTAHAAISYTNNSGGSGPNAPPFPCCGGAGGGGMPNESFIYFVDPSGFHQLPITTKLACDLTAQCLAANSTSIAFAHFSGTQVAISKFPKGLTGTSDQLVELGKLPAGVKLTGIAANDQRIAWVSSTYPEKPQTLVNCTVQTFDIAEGIVRTTFTSRDFACMGGAQDATHVYFTINIVPEGNDQAYGVHGIGLGRVNIATGEFEAIRLGMGGLAAGPRRVILDGDDVYAIDPAVIGKIAKSAFDGKHDF